MQILPRDYADAKIQFSIKISRIFWEDVTAPHWAISAASGRLAWKEIPPVEFPARRRRIQLRVPNGRRPVWLL